MSYNIYLGDLLRWAAEYEGEPFHALLCDPPYHLTEITKRFGSEDAAPAQYGSDGAFQRASKGFMGKQWDGGDIAFRSETWHALGRHLHPGAYGMAFASTRGYHRMACAIEDAGFIIHTMMGWAFGSGFPKATRIDVQLDRRAGAERPVVGERKQGGAKFKLTQQLIDNGGFNDPSRTTYAQTAPATELARTWEGHRYGGQAIKPAFEPIVVFQKPYEGRPVDCIARTGAGAINVDGGRVPGTKPDTTRGAGGQHGTYQPLSAQGRIVDDGAGRWPANLLLAHEPECGAECVPGCAVRRLGEQSGEAGAAARVTGAEPSEPVQDIYNRMGRVAGAFHGDTGTAARFFYNADWMLDRLDAADPVRYVAKASTGEREAGLDAFDPTTVDDGRAKSIDNPYQRGETQRRNIHPTVKPIDLCRYLATLLLPPAAYGPRRLLVPFAGSGSEMIGAGIAGWEHVEGIELEAEHVAIARARLAWWVDVFGEVADVAA